jgi:hypothetical protein
VQVSEVVAVVATYRRDDRRRRGPRQHAVFWRVVFAAYAISPDPVSGSKLCL